MSVSRKRLRIQEDSQTVPTESSSSSGAKKRMVQEEDGGKMDDRAGQRAQHFLLALKFEVADRDHVSLLKCSICSQFSEKLQSMRNFRSAFIDGYSSKYCKRACWN